MEEVRSLSVNPIYKDKMNVSVFKIHKPPAKDNYVAWLGGMISIISCKFSKNSSN